VWVLPEPELEQRERAREAAVQPPVAPAEPRRSSEVLVASQRCTDADKNTTPDQQPTTNLAFRHDGHESNGLQPSRNLPHAKAGVQMLEREENRKPQVKKRQPTIERLKL
jgi:hypothetical protein